MFSFYLTNHWFLTNKGCQMLNHLMSISHQQLTGIKWNWHFQGHFKPYCHRTHTKKKRQIVEVIHAKVRSFYCCFDWKQITENRSNLNIKNLFIILLRLKEDLHFSYQWFSASNTLLCLNFYVNKIRWHLIFRTVL